MERSSFGLPSTIQWSRTFFNQFALASTLSICEQTYGDALLAQLKSLSLSEQQRWNQQVKASAVKLADDGELMQIHVSASLLKCESIEFLCSQSERAHHSWGEGNIPLKIWRYANGTPLFDFDDDALSCQITAAFRSFSWQMYGFKVRLTTGSATALGMGMSMHTAGNTEDSHSLLNAPNLTLEPVNESLRVDDNTSYMGYTLLFSVNIVSTNGESC